MKLNDTKELNRDRFISVLGNCLLRAGFDESVGGTVLAGIRFAKGKVATDFAYHLTKGKGVVWGYSTGGVTKLPLPIDAATYASGLRPTTPATDGVAELPVKGAYITRPWCGYWIVGFDLSEQTDGQQQIAKLIAQASGDLTAEGILLYVNGKVAINELHATLDAQPA